MASRPVDAHIRHFAAPARLARLTLLGCFLALGFAHAAADVSVEFMNGALTAPQTFAGTGYHSIALVNSSDQLATFSLVRLHPGTSLGDYTKANDALNQTKDGDGDAAVAATKALLALADALSGTDVKPHAEITMYADLQAGTYVASALPADEQGPTGPTVYALFMVTESGSPAAAPETPYVVHFSDFAYDFPATIEAGTNLWQISNTGEQPHIAVFFKLLPGKTQSDLVAGLSDETGESGPPPFDTDMVFELEALSAGQTVYLPLDFAPGNWVAVCFVQDLDDPEVMHAMEGMIQEFAVN